MYETVAVLKQGFAQAGWGTIATGNSEQIAGLYAADQAFIVPGVNDPAYIPHLLKLCRDNQVLAILTFLDRDIVVLSQAASEFRRIGVMPLIVEHETACICDDKYRMYQFLTAHGFHGAHTYPSPEDFQTALARQECEFPVFAKPLIGDGSRGAMRCRNMAEVELCSAQNTDLIIQQYLDGPEYDVDVYVDTVSRQMVSVFAKEKLVKVIGGTATAISIKDEGLFTLVERLAGCLGAVGPLNMEIFKVGDEYYVGEVNPRFGATYIGAHACGIDFAPLIVNNIKGVENRVNLGDYREGITMMKYEDVHLIRRSQRILR